MTDLALFILRVGVGGMMLWQHGWPKFLRFFELAPQFPDPLHVGSTFSLVLTIFAEFFCSALVVLGIKTRYAAIPVVITMAVAAVIVHAADPLEKKEFAILYLIPFLSLALSGGGKYSFPSLAGQATKLQ